LRRQAAELREWALEMADEEAARSVRRRADRIDTEARLYEDIATAAGKYRPDRASGPGGKG
jgi:hypothetical protein